VSQKVVDAFIQRYGRLPTEIDPDYLEMLNMTKYRIKDYPDIKMAKCANCGATKDDGRKYVDFGLDVDWYGIVWLCGLCLRDIANAMGLFKDHEVKIIELELETKRHIELLANGPALQEQLEDYVNRLKEYYDSLFAVGNGISPNGTRHLSVVEAPEVEPTVDGPKSRTTKSSHGSGFENLRSLTDLLNNSGE
jgi:hypothetical protein